MKSFPGVDRKSFLRETAVKPELDVVVRQTTLKYIVAYVLVFITTYEENRVNISTELQIKIKQNVSC